MSNIRMINIQMEEEAVEKLYQRLGEMEGKSNAILKKEINKAAEQMKKSLSREAKKKYINTDVGMFRQAMEVRKATVGNPAAVIKAEGRPESLIKFRTAGGGDGKSVSAKVFRKSQLKDLTNTEAHPNIKSFIVTIKNNKSMEREGSERTAVVQRVEKGKVPARSRLGRRYIRELKGPSIPHMLGLRSIPEKAKEDTLEQLHRSIEAHVAKVLGG